MKLNLINGVPERVIMEISEQNNYIAKIIKSLGITYTHTVKVIYFLEKEKIITKNKRGRKIKIQLTKKGEKIQWHLRLIRGLI